MEVMTELPSRQIEVVISGAVTVETLRPIQQCVMQLKGSCNLYLIRASDVTSVEIAAAQLLQAMVVELMECGATVRWAAASRSLVRTARALDLDKHLGLHSAVPV